MALAALGDLDAVIPRYEQQVAGAPGEPSGYRLLSAAYLRAGEYGKTARTIGAGLQIAPR